MWLSSGMLTVIKQNLRHFQYNKFLCPKFTTPLCSDLNYKDFSTSDSKSQSKVKTGILMLNMGGPSTLNEVQDFLTRLFTDRDLIKLPFQNRLGLLLAKHRTGKIKQKYAEIGGGSPILSWTNTQGKLMVDLLDKISPETAPHKHYVGFRYAKPLMDDTILEMEKDRVQRAVAFSQYPQYSCSTSGSSLNALCKYYKNRKSSFIWSVIDRWSTHPKLVHCFADLIEKELNTLTDDVKRDMVILFSAHALPLSAVERGDSYPTEVAATVSAVMDKLKHCNPYRLVWQSKVGPTKWLSPQTEDAIKALVKRGRKHLMVVPIAFVNEHIETLHELDIEYGKDVAQKVGVKSYIRVPAPNDHPMFIEALADLVKLHLASNVVCSPQLMMRCPMCTNISCGLTRHWLSSLKL